MLGVVSRVLVIQQVRLAEKPHEEGSLLERLVGAAQAVAIRRRAAEEEAAKAAQPILIEARELVGGRTWSGELPMRAGDALYCADRAGGAADIAVDMMDNASALPTCPQRQQQQKTALRKWAKITTRLHEEAGFENPGHVAAG
jgi:hypothetical protein